MYMTAILDVYSRKIMYWDICNSMGAQWCKNVLEAAIGKHGKPEILNNDQGCQYTSALWTQYLEQENIRISMDGEGRALDNVWIQRFWKSLKHDYVYLNPLMMVLNFMMDFKTTSTTTIRKSTMRQNNAPMTGTTNP